MGEEKNKSTKDEEPFGRRRPECIFVGNIGVLKETTSTIIEPPQTRPP